jgi:hypothetical protein
MAALLGAASPGASRAQEDAAALDAATQLGERVRQEGIRTPGPGFRGTALGRARELLDALDATPAPSTPVPSTPVPSTPIPSTPVPSTPVPSTPVPSTPVPSTPVPSTPVPPSCQAIFAGPCDISLGRNACCVIGFPGYVCQTNSSSPNQPICTGISGDPDCQPQEGAPCSIGGYAGCCDTNLRCLNGFCEP